MIRPGPEKHGVWPNLSLDNALLILGVITGNYACAYSYAYRSIVGTGTVHRIQSPEMKRYGLERIMAHLAPDALPGFTDQALVRTKIYCIDIEKFTGKQRA